MSCPQCRLSRPRAGGVRGDDGGLGEAAVRPLPAVHDHRPAGAIKRLEEFTGLYPWQWTPADGEAFISHLRSGDKPIQMSTARSYEVTIGLFLEYLLDACYG